MWTRLDGESPWFCEPQWQSKAKNRQRVSALEQIPDESSNKPAISDTRGSAQKESEAELLLRRVLPLILFVPSRACLKLLACTLHGKKAERAGRTDQSAAKFFGGDKTHAEPLPKSV